MELRLPREAAVADFENRYGHLALFQGVDMVSVEHLLALCEEIDVAAGATVLEEGTCNDAIYIILDGALNVRLGATNARPLLQLGIGACVGELSILSRLNVSAYVNAAEDSRLLVIREEIVWLLIGGSHEFACNLLKTLSGRVRDDNTRLQSSLNAQARYAHASRVDALTGLFNRRWLDEVLDRQCRRCAADGTPLSLILIDIDHFKSVNDRFGHLAGDEALKVVAGHLRRSVRPVDLAARFGGEEFAMLLCGIDLDGAAEIGERIRQDLEGAEIFGAPGDPRVTVSLGISELQAFETPLQLLEKADRALYEAKRLGRNRVVTAPELELAGNC